MDLLGLIRTESKRTDKCYLAMLIGKGGFGTRQFRPAAMIVDSAGDLTDA